MKNLWANKSLVALFIFFLLTSQFASARVEERNDDVLGDGTGEVFGFVPGKKWQEIIVSLPASPKEPDLIPLLVYENPTYKYYIDSLSLNVSGEDNIVHYTIVIESPSGVRNIFNEGIRCDTRSYRQYGFALWGKPFSPIDEGQWQPISSRGVTKFRTNLYEYFFCESDIFKGNTDQVRESLRYAPDNNEAGEDD